MNFSPQQQAVIDFLESPKNASTPLIVDATAGSGKTTAIIAAAIASPDPTILLCAFNKRIADELNDRLSQVQLPRGRMIKAQTLHSVGQGIIKFHEPHMALDRDATDHLVGNVLPSAPFKLRRAVIRVVRYLKETCTPFGSVVELQQLLGQLDIVSGLPDEFTLADVALPAFEAMKLGVGPQRTFDFCDMIWRPNVKNHAPRGRYKTVIVDEGQDMTLGQFQLVQRLVAPGGRIVVVGDLRQEIYDWRGAAGHQIWRIMKSLRAAHLPLTWSFRCARSVVKQANVLVKTIEAAPDALDGVVDSMRLTKALEAVEPGDFFLSRTNAGAVTSALRAYVRGKAVRVLGGWEELDPLADLIKKLKLDSVASFRTSLGEWYAKQEKREDLTDAQAAVFLDRFTLLSEAVNHVEPRGLLKMLRQVFQPNDAPVALFSTVHKVKGLEAERVFLLKNTFARHRPKAYGPEAGQLPKISEVDLEELNIEYVAITRARKHLTWVLKDFAEDAAEVDEATFLKVAARFIDDDPFATPFLDAATGNLTPAVRQGIARELTAFPGGIDLDDGHDAVKTAIDFNIPIDFESEPTDFES